MATADPVSVSSGSLVQPSDVVDGLGAANRPTLCTFLALFDDSTLTKRLGSLYDKAERQVRRHLASDEAIDTAEKVRSTQESWQSSTLPDSALRLLVWIRLRESFSLPALLAISHRTARVAADDLAAAVLHHVDPPTLANQGKKTLRRWLATWNPDWDAAPPPVTLADVVRPVWADLVGCALGDGAGKIDEKARAELLGRTRRRLEQLDDRAQRELLAAIGADEFNDAAILKCLATGAGLAAFSGSVSLAGFSAYILAAQASAFIPLVSGPALVSAVAVLANPLTVVGLAVGGSYWWATSASETVRCEVAVRVIALLAMQGLAADRDVSGAVLDSFACMAAPRSLRQHFSGAAIAAYEHEWQTIAPQTGKRGRKPDAAIEDLLSRPTTFGERAGTRLANLLFPGQHGGTDTALASALTLGDIIYSAGAIRPEAIAAADFSRTDAIDDPLAFAEFACEAFGGSDATIAGTTNGLRGYIAEQMVAAELVTRGHQVEFPDASNQPGWDLLVDGQPFQVKCLDNPANVVAHFSLYDYPILANAELAGRIPEEYADRVFFVEGYTREVVAHVTDSSLESGGDLLAPDVPIIAFAVTAARNSLAWYSGQLTGPQAATQALLDGSLRVGLAAAGSFAGKGIGLLVYGPAGALVMGSLLPLLGQAQAPRAMKHLEGWLRGDAGERWLTEYNSALASLCTHLDDCIETKIRLLREKYRSLDGGPIADYVAARFEDDARALRESRARLRGSVVNEVDTPDTKMRRVLQWAGTSSVHPALYQRELKKLIQVFESRPPPTTGIVERGNWALQSGRHVLSRLWKDQGRSE